MKLKICFHGILGGRKGKDGKGGMWNPKELYDHFNERVIIPNQDSFDIEISIHSWNENEKNENIRTSNSRNGIIGITGKNYISCLSRQISANGPTSCTGI